MKFIDDIFSILGYSRIAATAISNNASAKKIETLLDAAHEKSLATPDRLSVVHDYDRQALFSSLYRGLFDSVADDIPQHGSPSRDVYLTDFWQKETLLQGAIYSMVAKASSLGWTVKGTRNIASRYAKMIARAGSYSQVGWTSFSSMIAQDFFTTDNGFFIGTPRTSDSIYAQLAEIEHIDSLSCTRTGSLLYPVYYSSLDGLQPKYLSLNEVVMCSSMPSAREQLYGTGYCAVSRAHSAAKILCMLYKYDKEKLSNLPPEGLVGISGLSMDEFLNAVELWKAKREETGSSIFPHILWLLGQDPQAKIGIDFAPFSTLPESFDRKEVITQYVNTLALVFGVDAREFWPVSTSSLGTAAESQIQHMKARGKGFGEFLTNVERTLNNELPEGAVFEYDVQDSDEDLQSANIAKAWVEALIPLATNNNTLMIQRGSGNAQNEDGMNSLPEQEAFITKSQLLRLLADRGVIPNYMIADEDSNRTVIYDISVMQREIEEGNDPVVFTFNPTTQLLDVKRDVAYELRYAALSKEARMSGQPISGNDAVRGNRITKKVIDDEIELWNNDPLLKQYANS